MPQLEDLLGTSCHGQNSILEQAVEDYQSAKDNLNSQEEQGMINYISCLAKIDERIIAYRNKGADWKTKTFNKEAGDSSTLGRNMTIAGNPSPCPSKAGQAAVAPNKIETYHIIPFGDGRFEKLLANSQRKPLNS
ncbi:hypothetical protein [Agaribacterium sp. ZY112]|uniref:hypothetical protein n=1 Tax=Agaribacterium sp. ZY112 TaxID=3233574 RepID=UPI00352314A9